MNNETADNSTSLREKIAAAIMRQMLEQDSKPNCGYDCGIIADRILALPALTHRASVDAWQPHLALISAVHAIIGYTESLKPGDVVTVGYVERLREHYVPNLLSALPPAPSGSLGSEKGDV